MLPLAVVLAVHMTQAAENRSLVSRTLGSHMVLQRGPAEAVVWGYSSGGVTVRVKLDGHSSRNATPDVHGTWRVRLPPMPAGGPHTLTVEAGGAAETLTDILFGDVYLCGGQSNMVFAMPAVTNATAEIAAADGYPHIRLFTVGESANRPGQPPSADLHAVQQPWAVASSRSVAGGGEFGEFSAVCWLFGRHISDGLGRHVTLRATAPGPPMTQSTGLPGSAGSAESAGSAGSAVPIGLISNNVGGTRIEKWLPPPALASCETAGGPHVLPPFAQNKTVVSSELWGAMVAPYTVGPMALSGIAWYQGEQNVDGPTSAESYRCTFPALVSSWRAAFRPAAPTALWFGFVQISGFCCAAYNTCDANAGRHEDQSGNAWAGLRAAQMSAAGLPMVGWSTNADRAQGCDVHPPAKQDCARRLADSALAMVYHRSVAWRSPRFKSQVAAPAGEHTGAITISLTDVGAAGLHEVYPFNYRHTRGTSGTGPVVPVFDCAAHDLAAPGTCAWAAVKLATGRWVNATVTLGPASRPGTVVLTPDMADIPPTARESVGASVASAYAWGAVPMMSLYDTATALPVLGWNETVAGP